MQKILASLGVGGATVKTVLSTSTVRPGGTARVNVDITGGNVEQKIRSVQLKMKTRYRYKIAETDVYVTASFATYRLAGGFTIAPGADKTMSADFNIPRSTPLTWGSTRVWIETSLAVPMAIDPSDRSALTVAPAPGIQAVFDATEALGLSFRNADCQADPFRRYTKDRAFVQEFTFTPKRRSRFAQQLDEVEFIFAPHGDALRVSIEVDRRRGLLAEVFDADERTFQFTLRRADQREAQSHIEQAIQQFL